MRYGNACGKTDDGLTIRYIDYPPEGLPRAYYIAAEDADEIVAGPYNTLSEAEASFEQYVEYPDLLPLAKDVGRG